jgi:DNA-binding XRE family transcriptional regulator
MMQREVSELQESWRQREMRKEKKEALERAGWQVGDAKDFLGLTDADMAVIDMRVSLATELRKRRLARSISQATLARRIGSSQSRVAKMEAGDPSVSLDLLIRCLLVAGVTTKAIAATIAQAPRRKARV